MGLLDKFLGGFGSQPSLPVNPDIRHRQYKGFFSKNKSTVVTEKNSGLKVLVGSDESSFDEGILKEINKNLALDLSNVIFKCDDENLEFELNVKPNRIQNSVQWLTEYMTELTTTGVAVSTRNDNDKGFRVINGLSNNEIKIDSSGKVKLSLLTNEELEFDIDELLITTMPIPERDSRTQQILIEKINSIFNSVKRSKFMRMLFFTEHGLQDKDLKKLQEHILEPSSSGAVVVDNRIRQATQINDDKTYNEESFNLALKTALNARKIPYNIYNQTHTAEEYNLYYFGTLMLPLKQFQQELQAKVNRTIKVIHASLINLTPEQLKIVGMLGGLKVDELRGFVGLDPVGGAEGNTLISNWNDKNDKNTQNDIDKKTEK